MDRFRSASGGGRLCQAGREEDGRRSLRGAWPLGAGWVGGAVDRALLAVQRAEEFLCIQRVTVQSAEILLGLADYKIFIIKVKYVYS